MAEDRPHSAAPRGKSWRDAPAPAAQDGPAPRKRRPVFPILAVMICLVGVLIGLFLLVNRFHEPLFLSIPITEYEAHYSPNAFARQDMDALLAAFPNRADNGFNRQEKDRLLKELKRLSTMADGPIIFHLCAY